MKQPASLQTLRSPVTLVVAMVLLVAALGIFWFFSRFERKEYEYRKDVSPMARQNPLLAASLYLQGQGKQCHLERGLALFANLPSSGDVIIVRRMPAGISMQMSENLNEWLAAGGHLIVAPGLLQTSHPNTVNFLQALGIKEVQSEDSDCGCAVDEEETSISPENNQDIRNEQQEVQEPPPSAVDCSEGYHPAGKLMEITVNDYPIKLEYYYSALLINGERASSWRVPGNIRTVYEEEEDKACRDHLREEYLTGDWLLQYPIGAGKVTVMADMFIFANHNIGEFDHAFFLSWLVGDATRVWLLQHPESESLALLIWHKAPWLAISLGMVIVLWLWHLQANIGPRRLADRDSQRNILAHIEAGGDFSWRLDKCRAMVEHNRRHLLGQLTRRRLGSAHGHVDGEIDLSILSARSGLAERLLITAFTKPVTCEQELIEVTMAMQKVQQTIHNGDRT